MSSNASAKAHERAMKISRCTGPNCGADIIWAMTTAGRPMPVDVERVAGGNIELDEPDLLTPDIVRPPAPIARVVKAQPGVWRYRSHHASCPDAWRFKRH